MPNSCAAFGLSDMLIRPVEPTDSAEWRRMRLALWPDLSRPDELGPDSSADDERGEVEWFH